MRKALLIALVLLPFWGISQAKKPIDGFLGIKFGSSKEEVIAALKTRGGNLSAGATDSRIDFTDVKFGTRKAANLSIYFINNKMYQGSFYFTSEHDADIIPDYKALVKDISDVYGKGKSISTFNSPYKEGDGDEVQAIKAGEASIYTDFKSDKNLLEIKIFATKDYDLYVIASYYDNTLSAQAEAKDKEKAKSDY